jgi:hypothetical protein
MYLIEWHVVDGGFGCPEEFEGAEGERTRIGRQRRLVENLADGGQVAAMVMRMIRHMCVVM